LEEPITQPVYGLFNVRWIVLVEVSEMSKELTRLIEAMLGKMEILELVYMVADKLVRFKFGQCLKIECHDCEFHPECGYTHKFLGNLHEMATFHLVSLANLLRERLGELRSVAEEKEEG